MDMAQSRCQNEGDFPDKGSSLNDRGGRDVSYKN